MKKILLSLLPVISMPSFAQHDIFLGGQFDLGIIGQPSFNNGSLTKKTISPHLGGLLFVNLRLFDVISLEVGAGQHWNNTRLRDPSFESENEGFSVELNNKNYYWNYYGAVSGMIKLGDNGTYLYGKLGYSYNIYGKQTITNSKPFVITRLGIDRTISSTTSYASSNQSFIPEIGLQRKFPRSLISLGLKTNIGRTDALNGSYTITNNVNGEAVTDNFSSLGNFTTLNFQYNVLLHHIPKREKIRRIPDKEKIIVIDEPKDKIPVDTIVATPRKTPTKVADRKLVVTRKVKVHSPKVEIMIWDHQTVDGDRVSINLNDEWILKNYTLKKEKHVFEVELEEGLNIFVLHALNLGKYSPNTAALIIRDGDKDYKIILESDLSKSGTLEINYKKKKK